MNSSITNMHGKVPWAHSAELGSALVEFAVTSVVLVLLAMWSHVFFDIIQTRMKLLEAARTAVWEFTAYPLTDYKLGTKQGHKAKYDTARDQISDDVKWLYENDLDSAYQRKKGAKKKTQHLTFANNAAPGLTLTIPAAPKTALSISALKAIVRLASPTKTESFNWSDFVSARTSAKIAGKFFAPESFHSGNSFQFKAKAKIRNFRYEPTLQMLVDSWKLEEGCNVKPDGDYAGDGVPAGCSGSSQSLLAMQVGRMSFQGFSLPSLGGASSFVGPVNIMAIRTPSMNFIEAPTESGQDGKDGMCSLDVQPGSVKRFFTAPYCSDTGGSGPGGCTGPYMQAFGARGEGFMGCPKVQYDSKQDCEYGQTTP